MAVEGYKYLNRVNSPADLKQFSEDELVRLSNELRCYIIDVISSNPGHFGAGLGVVEMTVALHYVFNAPNDKIIWDVGHQAYAHKILTGRRDAFPTNRTYKGISGFPKMSESQYDAFGVGHSSTSISAALGMAVAANLNGHEDQHHIAVIGDGALTAGQALEALNQAGVSKTNLLVILNDNGIAIDKSVGALKEYLTDITTSQAYNRFKDFIWKVIGGKSTLGRNIRFAIQRFENTIKTSLFGRSNLFESFKFRYFGPVDGHDVIRMARILNDIKKIRGPKILHCITVKGKGFVKAEQDKTLYHAPGIFNKDTGEIMAIETAGEPPKYQVVFGETLLELARQNKRIIGVTPAMATGCSLDIMMNEMPDRAFDVGITEQHAVTFSAGMATQGMIPFCNIYSSFMQRAYDQVIHDVALQKLPVVFCLDRGGLVGEDGPTHHGSFDLAYMRCIPNMIIASPMNEEELRNLMYTAQLKNHGPFSIRYPRGKGVMKEWRTPFSEIAIGTGRKLKEGKDLAILSIGHVGNYVTQAYEQFTKMGIDIAHYDMRFLKPIDEKLLHAVLADHAQIITVENGTIMGGLGTAVTEFINQHRYQATVVKLGIPDRFIEHGSIQDLHKECGYFIQDIIDAAQRFMSPQASS